MKNKYNMIIYDSPIPSRIKLVYSLQKEGKTLPMKIMEMIENRPKQDLELCMVGVEPGEVLQQHHAPVVDNSTVQSVCIDCLQFRLRPTGFTDLSPAYPVPIAVFAHH